MDKFLMICYVAADFSSREGETFSIKAAQIGMFVEAPGWVRDTLLFKWLLKDGSVKVAEQNIDMKQGENDPMKGIAADGKEQEKAKAAEAEVVEAVKEPEKLVKPRAKKAKKDDAK